MKCYFCQGTNRRLGHSVEHAFWCLDCEGKYDLRYVITIDPTPLVRHPYEAQIGVETETPHHFTACFDIYANGSISIVGDGGQFRASFPKLEVRPNNAKQVFQQILRLKAFW